GSAPKIRPDGEPLQPGLPGWLLAPYVVRRVDGEHVRPYAHRRLAVALAVRKEVEHPRHRGGEPDQRAPLADTLDRAGSAAQLDRRALVAQPERVVQGRPERLRVAGVGGGDIELRGLLAGEVRQVEAQVVEERHPVGAYVVPELRLPGGAGPKAAAGDAHDAGAAGLRLDEELRRQRAERIRVLAHEGGPVLLVDDAVRRVPAGDVAIRAHLGAHGEVQGAALAFLHLGRQEPGAHTFGGGDGLPDLLRGARNLDAELQAVRDVRGRAHALSSERGWAATTSRCGRPSSWW